MDGIIKAPNTPSIVLKEHFQYYWNNGALCLLNSMKLSDYKLEDLYQHIQQEQVYLMFIDTPTGKVWAIVDIYPTKVVILQVATENNRTHLTKDMYKALKSLTKEVEFIPASKSRSKLFTKLTGEQYDN